MDVKSEDIEKQNELLFAECKESVGDIFGWKVIIFLPQYTLWKVFVVISVIISFIITTCKVFYWTSGEVFVILEVMCDLFYGTDVVCATLHFGLGKVRKLRPGKKRLFFLLVMDYLSLLPLNLFYTYLIYTIENKPSQLQYILRSNVLLRTYYILMAFSDMKQVVCRRTTYYFIIFMEVIVYFALLSHLFGCILFLNFDRDLKNDCLDRFPNCVIENDLLALALLDNNYVAPFSKFPLEDYKYFLISAFLVGYFFAHGYITPLIIYVNLTFLREFFDYSNKRGQLTLLTRTLTQDKVLQKKISQYFHYMWSYGKSSTLPEIMKLFPLSFRKTVFSDIHWDALSHSYLLQDLSDGCKRSLSLVMSTDFVVPKTILFNKKELKGYFLYLQSGLIQIMAEENSESPLLNLSEGTVLSEISLFFQVESKAVLRTGRLSVIQFLRLEDLIRVLLHYPEDLKKMFSKMHLRLKVARAVQKSKTDIRPLFQHRMDHAMTSLTNVSWIKRQYRALLSLKKESEARDDFENWENVSIYDLQIQSLKTQLENTSMYLPLLCIDDEGKMTYNTVCVTQTFPFFMDPDCSFLKVWTIIIDILALIVIITYPAFLGWLPTMPAWFFNMTIIINFFYILDVLIQLMTAVRVKGVLIYKVLSVAYYRFSSSVFYLDILAALPLYLVSFFDNDFQSPFQLNLLLMNSMLKSYTLLPLINKLTYNSYPGIFYRAVLKYLFIMYFTIYWSAAIFNLIGVECIFYSCKVDDWYGNTTANQGKHYRTIESVFVSLFLVFDIPSKKVVISEFPTFVIYFIVFVIANFLNYAWEGECLACYILGHSNELEYQSLIKHVSEFMNQQNVSAMIQKRVISTLDFQWAYDKGNYITEKRRILEDLSKDILDEIDQRFLLPVLRESRLFKWESEEFFKQLCRRATRLALPANSVLLTFGTQTMYLYLIQKGHIQLNSFVPGDSHLNISTPLTFKSGDTFPVLVALSQLPSAVTVVTLSDCELLTLSLEDILTIMYSHYVLSDVVKALRETNLKRLATAELGLSRIKKVEFDEATYRQAFARLKFVGTLLRFILRKTSINSNGTVYLLWEFFRCALIVVNMVMWPLVFGCLALSDYKTTYIYPLLVIDIIASLIDFYIRIHVGYYNRLGIYVTHPLATFVHYLTSTFLVDLFAFVPNIHMIVLLSRDITDFSEDIIFTHLAMRTLPVYRIIGLLSGSLSVSTELLRFTKILLWTFLFFLFLHYYASVMVYFYLTHKATPEMFLAFEKKFAPKKPHEFYFYEVSLMLAILMNKQNVFEIYDERRLAGTALLGTLSLLLQTFFISILTINMAGKSESFTIYQYYFNCFRKFLVSKRTNRHILISAINYYKFKWNKEHGVNIHDVLSLFPHTLHEDIMYPLLKDTFSAVSCLSNANEAFYRDLARNIRVVPLMKSSVIIFKEQVMNKIFFVHKGKCYVEEVNKMLVKGAILGDIRREGIMLHRIVALTHVDLLMIPSRLFFGIITNFYCLKKRFESVTSTATDYLESVYFDPNINTKMEIRMKEKSQKESEFQPMDFEEKVFVDKTVKKVKMKYFFMPDSQAVRVFGALFFIDAYITFIIIPIFIGTELISWWSFVIIYFLDFFWILKIIFTIRTALINPKTGNYTYNMKFIAFQYLQKFDGMILHILSVLPIELIAVAYYMDSVIDKHCNVMCYLFFNRLLRAPHIHFYMQSRMKDLLANVYLKLLNISVFALAFLNLFACLNILLKRGKTFNALEECHWGVTRGQLDDFSTSYLFVLNEYVSGGLAVREPDNPLEVCFHLLIEMWGIISRAVVVNQVLIIISVTQHTKSYKLFKLLELEKYLSIRKISPALTQQIKTYCTNLLDFCGEAAHPTFLRESHPYIKTKIMEDIYIHLLQGCYLFHNIEGIFLRQLAMRLERFVFFPGDYILEKGDVDHNMYFINEGVVKCIDIDSRYHVLERTVKLFKKGQNFGLEQGIFLSCPHMNTYRAKVLSEILVLNFFEWEDMRKAFPEITNRIYKRFYESKSKEKEK